MLHFTEYCTNIYLKEKSSKEKIHQKDFREYFTYKEKKRENLYTRYFESRKKFQIIYPFYKPNTEKKYIGVLVKEDGVPCYCKIVFYASMLTVQEGLLLSAIGNKIVQKGKNFDS